MPRGSTVDKVLQQMENVWPGISSKYTGASLVANWWDSPLTGGAYSSPTLGTMTGWWGAQFETQGNVYFAGEACDYEFWSYMNGAIRAGARVAKAIRML